LDNKAFRSGSRDIVRYPDIRLIIDGLIELLFSLVNAERSCLAIVDHHNDFDYTASSRIKYKIHIITKKMIQIN